MIMHCLFRLVSYHFSLMNQGGFKQSDRTFDQIS